MMEDNKPWRPSLDADSMNEWVKDFLNQEKSGIIGKLPSKQVLTGKALALKKVEDLASLSLMLITDIDSRINLYRLHWSHLSDGNIKTLRQTLASAVESVLKSYSIEYERQAGAHLGLRLYHIDHWQAMVYYYYTPPLADEQENGVPGQAEKVDITHVFINNMDVKSMLPAHCLQEIEEEISVYENS